MLEIQKSKKARSDLKDIWKYSFDKWGGSRADSYYDKLEKAMNQIARTPKMGKPKEAIRIGLRGYHAGRHVIYYKIHTTHILVLRVLHDRSDPYLYED
jgi:toxin ParE1/3/4